MTVFILLLWVIALVCVVAAGYMGDPRLLLEGLLIATVGLTLSYIDAERGILPMNVDIVRDSAEFLDGRFRRLK